MQENHILCTKHVVLSRDVIWLNKTYGEYVSRKDHTKSDSFIIQDEDDSDKCSYVKTNPVNTEVNTEDIKTRKTLTPRSILGGENA